MEALVQHLVRPIVVHPDDVVVNTIEGEASIVLELTVHPDDRPALVADDERTLRAIRMLLSAAAGKRKATVELLGGEPSGDASDLDDGDDPFTEEDGDDDDDEGTDDAPASDD